MAARGFRCGEAPTRKQARHRLQRGFQASRQKHHWDSGSPRWVTAGKQPHCRFSICETIAIRSSGNARCTQPHLRHFGAMARMLKELALSWRLILKWWWWWWCKRHQKAKSGRLPGVWRDQQTLEQTYEGNTPQEERPRTVHSTKATRLHKVEQDYG